MNKLTSKCTRPDISLENHDIGIAVASLPVQTDVISSLDDITYTLDDAISCSENILSCPGVTSGSLWTQLA